MLMSLRDDVYRKVLSGEKIYEHRKVFPDEPVKAYIYVSAPTKAICGIMYLSNRTSLLKWKEQYKDDAECVKRIKEHPEITTVVRNINDRKTSMILGEREKVLYSVYGLGIVTGLLGANCYHT
nr:hypothetical protein [uncultured Anaerostipes sp.]